VLRPREHVGDVESGKSARRNVTGAGREKVVSSAAGCPSNESHGESRGGDAGEKKHAGKRHAEKTETA